MQAHHPPRLEVGAIYAILHTRSGDFEDQMQHCHFSIGIAISDTTVHRYHATNENANWDPIANRLANHWEIQNGPYTCTGSSVLVLLVKLGSKPYNWTVDHVCGVLNSVPIDVPLEDQRRFPRVNCQSYFVNAVRALHNSGCIKCPNPHALLDDCAARCLPLELGVMSLRTTYQIQTTLYSV